MAVTFIRAVILYICVVIALRLMGKRQIGEMQPKELVITILIAELAAIPMSDLNSPLINGVIAILTLIILEILLSVISLKSNSFRRILNGRPAIVINNGIIDQKALKNLRFTAEELMESLRQQDVFDINDVKYAIVETTGKLSVMLNADKQPVTPSDMNIAPANEAALNVCIICDGKIKKDSFNPVSYTHLDVYKRQVLSTCTRTMNAKNAMIPDMLTVLFAAALNVLHVI